MYCKSLNICLLAIYRSHSFSIAEFNNELENNLKNLNHKNIVIIGDMNIDLLSTSNDHILNYLNILSASGFISHVNEPTRISGDSKTCLDHIFIRFSNHNTKVDTAKYLNDITDHFPILCKISANHLKNDNTTTTKRCIDYKKIQLFLNSCEFYIPAGNDALDSFSFFHSSLRAIIDNYTYYKSYSTINSKKGWIDDHLLNIIKTKNRLFRKTLRFPGNNQYKNEYRSVKSYLKSKIKLAKKVCYQNEFEVCADTKSQWKLINSIVGQNIKNGCDGDINVDKSFCNSFNSYFVNIDNSIDVFNSYNYRKFLITYPNSCYFISLDTEEVSKLIFKFKHKQNKWL